MMVMQMVIISMEIRLRVMDDICKHLDKTREGRDRGEAMSFQCTVKGSGNI